MPAFGRRFRWYHPPVTDYRNTYREQLDRVRRFRARLDEEYHSQLVFQDIMWSFFQHCWHLKDWVKNDRILVTDAQRAGVHAAVHAPGSPLLVCRDLCNGTKHLTLADPSSGTGARHHHMSTTVFLGSNRPVEIDCLIDDGSGTGKLISGLQLAGECVALWEHILKAQGLDIGRAFEG